MRIFIRHFGIAATCFVLCGAPYEGHASEYTFTTFDFPNSSFNRAFGINDTGQIVGSYSITEEQGYLYSRGSFSSIDVPGSGITNALGINNSGQIVGDYFNATGPHGFLLSGGIFTALNVPGGINTHAIG